MKKWLVLLLAVLMLLSALVACGETQELPPDEPSDDPADGPSDTPDTPSVPSEDGDDLFTPTAQPQREASRS